MLLQSLLRPVLTPIMRGIFDPAQSVSAAWSPLSLWPDGISSAGMWISPRTLDSEWQDYTGTTPVAVPGTVADSSNPVGLALDIRAGATVLTDPGNHMLQSTSAARPLLSARVNLLTYTEDLSHSAVYGTQFSTVSAPTYPDPFGGNSANKFTGNASSNSHRLLGEPVVGEIVLSLYAKTGELRRIGLLCLNPAAGAWFDLTSGTAGVLSDYPDVIDYGIEPAANGFYRCWIHCSITSTTPQGRQMFLLPDGGTSFGSSGFAADAVGVYVTGAQFELGSTATPYQAVLGDGSTYATDFPIFQKYDGVDDGMATAAFPAGTLINGMDCMIAVRRDSGSTVIFFSDASDEYFGYCATGSGAVNTYAAGSPTVWVDGVQLSGGTSVTAGAIDAALTVGDWHILEFRGLDLSTWASFCFSKYFAGTYLPGARGDILLFPSTASTEDKDAARQYLADYYGVTLP